MNLTLNQPLHCAASHPIILPTSQEAQLDERQSLTEKNTSMALAAERVEAQRVEEQPQVEEMEWCLFRPPSATYTALYWPFSQ